MPNRTRKHKFTLYLSDDEYRILEAKSKMSKMQSKSAVLRQLIVEAMLYDVDYSYLREYNALLGHVSGNINQIAKRANETRSIYQKDVDELKKEIDEIWRLQKSILSRQPYLVQ